MHRPDSSGAPDPCAEAHGQEYAYYYHNVSLGAENRASGRTCDQAH